MISVHNQKSSVTWLENYKNHSNEVSLNKLSQLQNKGRGSKKVSSFFVVLLSFSFGMMNIYNAMED